MVVSPELADVLSTVICRVRDAAGAVPLAVMMVRRTRTMGGVVAASGLVVAALWVKRLVIVIPPATEPLVRSPLAAGGVLTGGWGTYHFTWVPISITLAATAAVPLLLLVLFRFVPILPIAEMEELESYDEELAEAVEITAGTAQPSPGRPASRPLIPPASACAPATLPAATTPPGRLGSPPGDVGGLALGRGVALGWPR